MRYMWLQGGTMPPHSVSFTRWFKRIEKFSLLVYAMPQSSTWSVRKRDKKKPIEGSRKED